MPIITALAIVVHVTNLAAVPARVMRDAQSDVEALFRDVGISIEWIEDGPASDVDVEARLIIVADPTGALANSFHTVLGASSRTPRGLGNAWVFYNRIAEHSDRYLVPLTRLLACSIAHELGHVLQREPSHADRGLMRATWRRSEYRGAALGRLKFSETDLFR